MNCCNEFGHCTRGDTCPARAAIDPATESRRLAADLHNNRNKAERALASTTKQAMIFQLATQTKGF